jgi:hypothetical protein
MTREITVHSDARTSRLVLGILLSVVVFGAPAIGGQQEAGIIGQLTDESGAVLPGVSVTATGPALQVPSVTTVTNENGEYRLTPLPIGSYNVQYELSGFQTLRREGVRLTQGFVAKIDIVLKVGILAETVTVSGASPVVDVTSTKASTQLTRETLEAIPTSRNGTPHWLNRRLACGRIWIAAVRGCPPSRCSKRSHRPAASGSQWTGS